jgi:hypothetical protein
LAVHAAVQHLAGQLEQPPQDRSACQPLLEGALDAARAALQVQASEGDMDELATTLLLAVATDRWVGVLQIGDGAIVCHRGEGRLEMLSRVDGDASFINETTFVTSSTYASETHTRILPREDILGIAVCTDGVAHLAVRYRDQTPHPGFFAPLFEFAQASGSSESELEEFLNSDRVNERTDDDKTLVIAVRDDPH